MRERYAELDALRGLAALSVVSHHVLLSQADQGGWLWHKPLNCGHEAVLLFFVLSGFVLNLPFLERAPGYAGFVVRRLCRIYPAYLVAIACSALLMAGLGGAPVPGGSSWTNGAWQGDAWASLASHANLLATMAISNLEPVAWSLVIELRLSLLFPLLALVFNRLPWPAALAAAFGLEALGVRLDFWLITRHGVLTDYLYTLHYAVLFVIGMLAARHRHALVAWVGAWSGAARAGLLALGLACFYAARWLTAWVPLAPLRDLLAPWGLADMGTPWRFEDPLAGFGVACLLVLALGSPRLGALLRWRPLAWLGDVSYSLYLYHAVVLLAALHALGGHLPVWLLAPATVPVSLLLAWASWRWVELPGQRLGRQLVARARSAEEPAARTAA